MAPDGVEIRPAQDGEQRAIATLLAAVAEERDGIATEPPVDVDALTEKWRLDGSFVAVAGGEIVGHVHIEASRFGFGELGMLVADGWRSRGVGTALVAAAIEWRASGGCTR